MRFNYLQQGNLPRAEVLAQADTASMARRNCSDEADRAFRFTQPKISIRYRTEMETARVYNLEVSKKEQGFMERLKGKVAWFNNAKGYGFLAYDGGPDVFVHFSSIQATGYKSLTEGDEVVFNIVQGEKGLQADAVELLKQP